MVYQSQPSQTIRHIGPLCSSMLQENPSLGIIYVHAGSRFFLVEKLNLIRLGQDETNIWTRQHFLFPSRFPSICADERVFREPPPGHPARLLAAAGVLGHRRPRAKPQMVPRRPTPQSGEFVS